MISRSLFRHLRDIDQEVSRAFRMPSLFLESPRPSSRQLQSHRSNTPALFEPASSFVSPNINLAETKTDYVIEAELPGIKKEDVEIELVDNDRLVLRGKIESHFEEGTKPTENANEGEKELQQGTERKYWHVERQYGEFERVVSFPGEINTDAIKAEFKDGLLTVQVPKVEPQETKETVKKIAIA